MGIETQIQLFDNAKIRVVWDDEKEKYFFSVVDVVGVLTDSADGRTYWKVLKNRLLKEGNETVTNCNQLKLPSADGKMRERLEEELGTTVISNQRAVHFVNPPDELPLNQLEE